MVCEKCNKRMVCKDSREQANVRFRLYQCPKCCGEMVTKEKIMELDLGKKVVRRFHNEENFGRRKERQFRKAFGLD